MVITINMPTIPHGVTGKEPPPNRGQLNQPPPDTSTIGVSGMSQGNGNFDLNLLRLLIEHMECGNIRIRKLNKTRRQRRIDLAGLCDVSDSEEEEAVPNISSYIFPPKSMTHTTTFE